MSGFAFWGRAAAHAHGSGSARARGRTGTQAALGSFSFARRRNIGRERQQKRLASTRNVAFSGLATPFAVPGRVQN